MKNSFEPKIAVMLIADSLEFGGAEMVIYNLALNLDQDRFKVSVCCLEGLGEIGEKLKEKEIDIIDLGSRKGMDLFLSFKLARILRDKNIQLIHAHNSTATRHSVIAAKLARVSTVIQTRHGDELSRQTGWRKRLRDLLSHYVLCIVTICEHLKNKLIENEKIKSEKITVIHNGIDIEKYKNIALDCFVAGAHRNDKLLQKKQKLGLDENDFIFINVANIRPEKGQDILIKAFSEIARKNKNAKLLIAGGESDKRLADSLKELVKKLDLKRQVIFLGQRDDVAELLSISDVFVLSSLTEGMPMSILEAMACGKPVIATNVGGIPEVIKNDVSGLLVAPNSPSELSQAMLILMSNKEIASRLKNQGKIAVEQLFSVRDMVNNYQNLYEQMLPKKKILIIGIIPPPYGGMSIYVHDLLNSELKNKYSLIHFDTTKKTSEKEHWISRINFQIRLLGKLFYTLAKQGPALVHMHICSYFSFFRSSLDFIIAKFIFRRKVILHIHGAYFDKFYVESGRLKKMFISFILNKTDKIIVLSSYWKDILSEMTNNDRISVVENGIYTDYYQNHYLERLKSGQMNNGQVKFIFLGEIGKRKGIEDILKAISILKDKNTNFRCFFAGNYEDGNIKVRIQDYAQKNNIERYTDFVGTVWGEEKYHNFLKSDVFILPSYAENLPIAVLEAMASGLPVVVSKVGAIPEIIKDGVNGFLIDPGDYQKLAEKMFFLIENPAIRAEMGKVNSEYARQKYDFKRVTEELDCIYSELVIS